MTIVYTLITASLMTFAFYAGMSIANSYHREAQLQEDITLRHYHEAMRQSYYATEAQRAYAASYEPVYRNKCGFEVPEAFEHTFHDNGRATMMIKGGQKQ